MATARKTNKYSFYDYLVPSILKISSFQNRNKPVVAAVLDFVVLVMVAIQGEPERLAVAVHLAAYSVAVHHLERSVVGEMVAAGK